MDEGLVKALPGLNQTFSFVCFGFPVLSQGCEWVVETQGKGKGKGQYKQEGEKCDLWILEKKKYNQTLLSREPKYTSTPSPALK